jgi:hypothetical protein
LVEIPIQVKFEEDGEKNSNLFCFDKLHANATRLSNGVCVLLPLAGLESGKDGRKFMIYTGYPNLAAHGHGGQHP